MPDLIARLANVIESGLAPRVERDRDYALLDFPDHSNVGDSAIWLGELDLLAKLHGRPPAYVCATSNYDEDELDRVLPEGMIYLHGGGNFGDLYPRHQNFREKILARYGSRVVQLPQSVHYSPGADLSNIRRLARTSGATICARDKATFARMSELGFDPLLLPDSALCLGPLRRPWRPRQDVLVLKRTDKESVDRGEGGVDWLGEPRNTLALAKLRAGLRFPRNKRRELYLVLARTRVARGLRLLSMGRAVVTDRLHAHILSLLLGIPHVAADNSTGKIHAFIDEWTHPSPLVTKAGSISEALAIANGREFRASARIR